MPRNPKVRQEDDTDPFNVERHNQEHNDEDDSISNMHWEGVWVAGTYDTGSVVRHEDALYIAEEVETGEPALP